MWLVLATLCAPAPAQEALELPVISDFTRSVHEVQLAEGLPVWLREPLVFQEGPVTVRLEDGYLMPVVSGRTAEQWADLEGKDAFVEAGRRGPLEVVGFAWVDGTGTLETAFPERGDALRFANRMVRIGEHPREDFAPVAAGEPFRTTVSRGLVLGRVAELRPLVEARLADDADETIEVVADRRPASQARREAGRLLRERLELYDDAQLDAEDWIAIDRLESELYGISELGAHKVLDFQTGHRFPVTLDIVRTMGRGDEVEERRGQRLASQEWLSVVRDDTGGFDSRLRTSVLTLYRHASDPDEDDEVHRSWEVARVHVAGEPFPPLDPDDPHSAPAAPRRLEAVHADSRLLAAPRKGDVQVLQVDVQSEVTLRSVGENGVFSVVLPRGRQREGLDARVQALMEGGLDVLLGQPEWDESRVWLALPRPLTDGEELHLILRHTAYWTVGHQEVTAAVSLGTATGPRPYLPVLGGGYLGNTWRFVVEAGVDGAPNLLPAASGEHADAWERAGAQWIRAEHEQNAVMFPMVAVGKWHTYEEEPYEDLPGVKVHLLEGRDSVLESFPPEVRRVGVFLDRFLPTFPAPEIDVVEDAGSLDGISGLAPYGMVAVSRALTTEGHGGLRNDAPHLENALVAHELAHQYWGHMMPVAHGHDGWINESMAETFARMYLRAAFGPQDCEVRMKASRRLWEKELARMDVPASLTRAPDSPYRPSIVYQYGPYVLFEMLRPRIGDIAFYGGINDLFEEHPYEYLTTERLQAALEDSSGRDLDDFFQFWVEQGQLPRILLEWMPLRSGNMVEVRGRVTTDVPFGTFDVPVHTIDAAGVVDEHWVTVVDGVGTLDTPTIPGTSVRVRVDPEHLVLARERKAKKVKELGPRPP